MANTSSPSWPDSHAFWRDKRVIVTGGAGFLGSFVVEKLEERGAAEIIVPRSRDYDLTQIDTIRQLFHDVTPKSQIRNSKFTFRNHRHPPGCPCGRNWSKQSSPGRVFLR